MSNYSFKLRVWRQFQNEFICKVYLIPDYLKCDVFTDMLSSAKKTVVCRLNLKIKCWYVEL